MGHPSPGQTEKPFTFISLKLSQILIRENFKPDSSYFYYAKVIILIVEAEKFQNFQKVIFFQILKILKIAKKQKYFEIYSRTFVKHGLLPPGHIGRSIFITFYIFL